MNGRDPHSALRSEIVTRAKGGLLEAVVVRLQWAKNDVGYSLHVSPGSFSMSGIQRTDFLAYLGFARNDQCTFTNNRQCFVKWVDERFDPDAFAIAFNTAFTHLEGAERSLEACGFLLNQPEGWGFYYGKPSLRRQRGYPGLNGDGHTALIVRRMKETEDESFLYRFTFIETEREKGFVTHYRPKHPPLSSELSNVLGYLGMQRFNDCPEFEFEECYFRTMEFVERGDGPFDTNTEYAHRCFDAHKAQFSSALRELLSANEIMESIGMVFLPLGRPADRLKTDIDQRIIRPSKPASNAVAGSELTTPGVPSNFDVSISVAGSDKKYALELAERIRAAGYSVFYYEFYPEYLWGKNLPITFDEIFRKRSRYCVIFVSKDYSERVWTNHEMRSAQARAIDLKGKEYILPIRIDDTELEGLLPTVGYLPIDMGINKIGDLLIRKLQS